jgi:hypothetical protein
MNYATWKLNFTDPNYGTGPEDKIVDLGYGAEAGWVQGEAENGGTILGYVTDALDESQLTAWQVTNISQSDALDFCLDINPAAYLLPDGKITAPIEETTI